MISLLFLVVEKWTFSDKRDLFYNTIIMSTMKDKIKLGNTGNVLHEFNEGQNQAGKYGKCPS
jgi:hypothetical protein